MALYVQNPWQQIAPPGGDGLITVIRCYDLTVVNAGTEDEDKVVGAHMNTTNQTRPSGFNRNGCFFIDNATGTRVTGLHLKFLDRASGTFWTAPLNISKGRSIYTAAEFADFTADSPSGSYTSPTQYHMNPVFDVT